MGIQALSGQQSMDAIVGWSPETRQLRNDVARVAPFKTNVLITGPSGVGKELVARQIHAASPRTREPFIPVDCASMTGELMASQLFGHVAGAFTGANCHVLGCFRAAHRGTIFLDEIGELEYPLQAKLLRVLQERMVTPVGSHRAESVDVRVVAATNRDLGVEVSHGRFREDLYYRLHVVRLAISALCERRDDVVDLTAEFLRQLAAEGLPRRSLSSAALDALLAYDWPGNVRQLRNVLEQAVIECEPPVVSAGLLRRLLRASHPADDATAAPPPRRKSSAAGLSSERRNDACAEHGEPENRQGPAVGEPWPTLAQIERRHLMRTLEHTFYNRTAAARLLGLTRQSLLRLTKRHDIAIPRPRPR